MKITYPTQENAEKTKSRRVSWNERNPMQIHANGLAEAKESPEHKAYAGTK
jgi:hypothetical protein